MIAAPKPEACCGLQAARRGLIVYLLAIIILSALAVGIVAVRRYIFHDPYPRSTVLFMSGDRFNDFLNPAERVKHYPEPDFLTRPDFVVYFNYGAPTLYPFLFFIRFFPNPLYAYLGS
jgi:hypothetical protein